MLPDDTLALAADLLTRLRARGFSVATAESCTGGLISAALTAVPGSSDVVLGGFVTYSNAMKTRLLGVPEAVLAEAGAVSEACARAMATGALRASGASLAVSVTGVAGPGGGSEAKPVGLVWIGGAGGSAEVARRFLFPGDRAAVRAATVREALRLCAEMAHTA